MGLYGKIPAKMLEQIVFKHLGAKRNDVIVGPSRGEDAAIIKGDGIKFVTSCDPISGAINRLGWLAVHIAANDIATRGVKPSWYLSCILLPKNDRNKLIEICRNMDSAAKKLNIAIIGGHSEVTPGISHPIIVGFCAGVVKNNKYYLTGGAKPGSKIVLTKGAGIEGTGIIASDLKKIIVNHFNSELATKAERYLDFISVVPEALLASKVEGVLAMHDPTEGGVAGGLNEIADASQCGFKVYEKDIFVSEETGKICSFLKIDPLKLISSGSLLIAVKDQNKDVLLEKMKKRGIKASIIGEFLTDKSVRFIERLNGREKKLSMPQSDELWKVITSDRFNLE
jgi:hydrogenase maturation factor